MSTKQCTKCLKYRLLGDFPTCKNSKDGHQSWCIGCYNTARREYYRKNKERAANQIKIYNANNPDRQKGNKLRQYWPGCTWQEALKKFQSLVESQHNLCAICNKPEIIRRKINKNEVRDLAVDHCHSTGKVRGLLCAKCNVLIGQASDNTDILYSAIKYIKDSQ